MNYAGKVVDFVVGIYKEKCPNCVTGHVFEENTSLLNIPKMNEQCSNCSYRFEREPGYFIGAMYLSYGLAILEGILAFLFGYFLLPEIAIGWMILLVILPMFLFAKKNYKWSRIIYIKIFPW